MEILYGKLFRRLAVVIMTSGKKKIYFGLYFILIKFVKSMYYINFFILILVK
jgi:hypothetical protein